MHIRWFLAICLVAVWTAPTFAQLPWQYRWQKGDTLLYKVKHLTNAYEVVDKKKTESNSKLELVKRWQITDVDDKGTATMERSFLTMRYEQRRTNGDILLFDSENLEKCTPELREQMSKLMGKTLEILRVDRYGRALEAKMNPLARYDAEPPFAVVFPVAKAEAGQAWRRPFTMVMEPPQGTGEKYDAEQVVQCKKLDGGVALLTVTTQFKALPDNMADRLPLLQKDVQGEVVFDLPTGRTTTVQLNIDKTIENHQGKGSSYRFQSQYSEVLVK